MSLADFGITEQRINLIFILFVAVFVVLLLISLFLRSLKALSLYDILRRQGNSRAWYSFVPLFSDNALDMAANNKRQSSFIGKFCAVLSLASVALGILSLIFGGIGLSKLVFAADKAYAAGKQTIHADEFKIFAAAIIIFTALIIVLVLRHILKTVLLNKIYASFGGGTLYTVLGFILPFLTPIFLRFISQKDIVKPEGMSYFTEQG